MFPFKKKYLKFYRPRKVNKLTICGLLRVRNEELILQDTLDHLSEFCDGLICYDDASTDKTFEILMSHQSVVEVIQNLKWLAEPTQRIERETLDRKTLLDRAEFYKPSWLFYADADERFFGNIKDFLFSAEALKVDGIRIQLFDAYITLDDQAPFCQGKQLKNFRTFFGPERRDILMIWRNSDNFRYEGLDAREPKYDLKMNIITKFYCQHYGKSLSIDHWEETCQYYINHFPFVPYGKKWTERQGKAIHSSSDFGRPLYQWGEDLFSNSVRIHP
ncbi:MAG: glycosyltransferase family 2 protein [Almyronema sp.]